MRVHACDHWPLPLPDKHRFPIEKYALLRRALVDEGVLAPEEIVLVDPVPLESVLAVHDTGYARAFAEGRLERAAQARIGFPWSPELVRRSLASVAGTLAAADAALEEGASGTLAGGTHHAHRDFGAGFCVFNDVAIAARALLDAGRIRGALVVDLDVHQGDGTAAIFREDERVFTLSLHGEKNFPARKMESDLDVALPDGTGDERYLEELERALAAAFARSRADVLFYQGGVDPLESDRLGRLALTHAGLRARDRLVFEAALRRGLPLVATLGGGYAQPIEESVRAHVGTYRELGALFRGRQASAASNERA